MVDPQPTSRVPRSRIVARRIARAWRDLGTAREIGPERTHLPAILGALDQGGVPDAVEWIELRVISGDPTIFIVGPAGGLPAAAIRIARGPAGRRGLTRAAAALTTIREGLGETDAGAGAAALLPRPLGSGELAGRSWLAESALPGRSGRSLLGIPTERRAMLQRIADGIAIVHAAGSLRVPVTDVLLTVWIDRRVALVRSILDAGHHPAIHGARLTQIESELRSRVLGREMSVGWIHGDLWPANVLVGHGTHHVTGILDWDSAAPRELPLHDLLHLAITTRQLIEHRHLGQVMANLLGGATWTPDDRAALSWDEGRESGPMVFDGLEATTALRLYWLRAIELNIDRRPALGHRRSWVRTNVVSMLA